MYPSDLESEVAAAARVMGGTDAVVFLCDYDQRDLVAFDEGGPTYPIDDSPPGDAFRLDRVVEEQLDDRRRRLWVPVRDSSEREGVLGVSDDGSVPIENWIALASLVGELVASKQEYGDHITVRRRREKFSPAAEMRWAMLPPLTFTSPDVTITGFLQPTDKIGGDAFDYAVTGRSAAVAVFDALGHGLEASRIANLAVGTYRNCRRNGDDIVTTLATIDRTIEEQFGDSAFVTAQLATLDLDTGALEVVNAGHPLPLQLRKGTAAEEIPCPPTAPAGLGCEPAITRVQLDPGDAVLFRTDGVVDARSPGGEDFSEKQLIELVDRLMDSQLQPSEVLRQTVHAIVEHRDVRVGDDATLLLLAWKRPEPGPTE